MNDEDKTKEQLLNELSELRKRVAGPDESRKRAGSESRYRNLFETLPDGFSSVNMDKRIIEANAALQAMVGYTEEDLRCLTYEDLTPEKWHALEDGIIREQVMTRGYSDLYEKEYVRKDGTILPVEVRVHLLRGKDGKPVEMWGFVRDITRRKQTEETLKETEERYRALVRLSPMGIFVHSNDGIEFANPAYAQMLGAETAEELYEKPPLYFVHPDYVDHIRAKRRSIIVDKQAALLSTHKMVRLDGRAIDVEAMSFPFRHKGRAGVMVVVQDVTQRKQAEEALRSREWELEDKSVNLEEANAALKVLLRHRDEDKKTLETRVLENVRRLVFPYIEKLRGRDLTDSQATCLNIIESNLNEVVSPFLQKMTALYVHFTPTEVQVADLVKDGRTSKEIGEFLNVGKGTVHTHRNNIRKKLGLSNEKTNLRAYLLSLQE